MMKTKLLNLTMIVITTLISICAWGQEDLYISAMKSTIEIMNQAKEPGDFVECANQFDRIARYQPNTGDDE